MGLMDGWVGLMGGSPPNLAQSPRPIHPRSSQTDR